MRSLALALLLVACGGTSEKPKTPTCDRQDDVQALFDERLEARATGGWVSNDCDAFLWNSKLYSVTGAPDWSVEEAEMAPGLFGRRPTPCWTEKDGDLGAQTTWSRDQARGLFLYAWRNKKLDLLHRHLVYGQHHNWVMGQPLADGRVLYSPALIGALAQTIYALGGVQVIERRWPDLYPVGLVDYQAHLQVLSIQHRGEVEEALRLKDGDAIETPVGPPVIDEPSDDQSLVLDISPDMKARLFEHVGREPENALFQAALARYTGDQTRTEATLLAKPWFRPSYVRCADQEACDDIEWLSAADVYLRACKGS